MASIMQQIGGELNTQEILWQLLLSQKLPQRSQYDPEIPIKDQLQMRIIYVPCKMKGLFLLLLLKIL